MQAYEQGRAEIPGLVSKVLRLMCKDSVFRALFQGELSTDDYSNLANIVDHNTENSIVSK